MNDIKDTRSRLKMHFPLEVDKDGWPPVAEESIWVKAISDNLFEVDNVPFFVKLIAYKDQVEGVFGDGNLYFKRLVKASGYATIRLIYREIGRKDVLISTLVKMGCEIEEAGQYSLVAIGISSGEYFEKIMALIREGFQTQAWDYEEGCLPAKKRRTFWDAFRRASKK